MLVWEIHFVVLIFVCALISCFKKHLTVLWCSPWSQFLNIPGKSQIPRGARKATENYSITTTLSKFTLSFCALGNIFKSFYHYGPLHHKYFIVFNAINRFNIGLNGPTQNPWMKSVTQYCHHASLCYWAGLVSFFSKHFSTGRPLKRQ